MEKNIKRYTVTTVLEYDKEGDVTREERCEDTEYYDPNGLESEQLPYLEKYYFQPLPE